MPWHVLFSLVFAFWTTRNCPGLGGGCISCHEGLALTVSEDAALSTATLRQQAARREDTSSKWMWKCETNSLSSISNKISDKRFQSFITGSLNSVSLCERLDLSRHDMSKNVCACGVELYELQVLHWQTGPGCHGTAVACQKRCQGWQKGKFFWNFMWHGPWYDWFISWFSWFVWKKRMTLQKGSRMRNCHQLHPPTCACVRRGAGLICSSKAAGGNDGAVGTETMDWTILHAPWANNGA